MRKLLTTATSILVVPLLASAQGDNYLNSIGGGLSYGDKLNKDADFWGWTLDYSRVLNSGWVFTAALAYDEETERRNGQQDKIVQSYTPTFSWSYPISARWSLATGLGKGLFNDDNKEKKMELTEFNEEWAVGAIAAFTLFQNGRHRTSISSSLEYNISEGEPALSVDIGYAYSF